MAPASGLKSLIVIALALLHFAKSAATKKHRSSYPQGAIPAPCKGSSAGFKYARFLSTFHRGTFSGDFFVGYSRICGSIQRRTV
eukprot:CCRYP_013677-RB/>CCRYP_013677-RB protein AED:0.20 eAED:0.20 QI:0/-1/0/1/-1/0/1/0/83